MGTRIAEPKEALRQISRSTCDENSVILAEYSFVQRRNAHSCLALFLFRFVIMGW